jgi:hypothetical protein
MPKWREIAKVLEVDIQWLLAEDERALGDDESWLKASMEGEALPLGLQELIEDEALLKGLRITGLEWTALHTLKAPSSLTKEGYVAVLYALRNGCAQDTE